MRQIALVCVVVLLCAVTSTVVRAEDVSELAFRFGSSVEEEIFSDGFEGGDTLQWSATVPPTGEDGSPCSDDRQCVSDHCQNSFCCASGDCCNEPLDCPEIYSSPAECDNSVGCQGSRWDSVCREFICADTPVEDDSDCDGSLEASGCGPYPSVYCSGEVEQSAPICATSCISDGDCDSAFHCSEGICVADILAGGSCLSTTECADSLSCVDGVCCTGACVGLCERCDLSGTGSCEAITGGLDPDNECSGFSCSSYLQGWVDDICYLKSDVSDSVAACDGEGLCQTPEFLCPLQPNGDITLSCDPICQEPTFGTCVGSTPGSCTNLNLGTESCGQGACLVTVDQCTDGSQNPCVPFPPSNETCNNIDDDCDGTIDEDISGVADEYEPNDTCSLSRPIGTVSEDDEPSRWTATIYPAGDQDYFRFHAVEGNNVCLPGTAQPYSVSVRLVPPSGPDCRDYDLYLYDDSCSQFTSDSSPGCDEKVLEISWDGTCGVNDSRYFRVAVKPSATAWECAHYDLYINMW